MTCVGIAGNGAEALALCAAEQPDVLLLDLRMPVMNGIETMARLAKRREERPRVIALTTIRRDDAVLAALRAGAAAFLTKDALPEVVTATIRDVHEGRPAPTEAEALDLLRTAGTLVEIDRRDEVLDALTAREREVFLLLAKGSATRRSPPRCSSAKPPSRPTSARCSPHSRDVACQKSSGYRQALYDAEWSRLLHVTAPDAAALDAAHGDQIAVDHRLDRVLRRLAPSAPAGVD